jgi:hypothetical protein
MAGMVGSGGDCLNWRHGLRDLFFGELGHWVSVPVSDGPYPVENLRRLGDAATRARQSSHEWVIGFIGR